MSLLAFGAWSDKIMGVSVSGRTDQKTDSQLLTALCIYQT